MLKQASLILTSLMITAQAASADWYVQPKIGFESRSYELSINSDSAAAKATIPSMVFGISIINSAGWYIDLDFTGGDSEVSGFYPEDDYIESFNTTLSGGASLGNGFTIFGGHNTSDTQIENHKKQPNQGLDFQFVSSGFFGGVAKSFALAKNHSVTVSGALGLMTGEYQAVSTAELGGVSFDAEGAATGYSGNITYTYRPTTNTALTVGLKAQAYTYTDMKDVNTDDTYADADENLSSAFAKASYTF